METPSGWTMGEGKLVREFLFDDFEQTVRFINGVAGIAERMDHHPEIWNSYNKVKLILSTHDAKDTVTEKDYALALEINNL